MTTCMAILAAACAVAQTMTFTGRPEDGVCVDVPETTAFTVSAWVDVQTARLPESPYPRLFQLPCGYLHFTDSPETPEATGFLLGLYVSKELVPRGISSWPYAGVLPLKRWAHVAVVCRADSSMPPELYVNGSRIASRALAARPLPAVFKGGKATIGNSAIGGNRPMDGRVSGFRFEPRALSAKEIVVLARVTPDGNPPIPYVRTFHDELPIIDLSHDTFRQTVIASGADGVYQGHPTTVVAPDGTIYCVWTIKHGGKCGPMAKSTDGGKTWTRCDGIMPEAYRTHGNCPTLQTIRRPDGGVNLAVFSSKHGCGIVISPDGGQSWWEAPTAKLSAGMPPTGFMMLKDGSAALFGQIRNDPRVKTDRATDDQSVWMSISKDGGWTWGPMRVVATAPQKNLCEPFCLRSPDGNELCLLIRENRHKGRSMMCFSRDEGKTWTKPEDTCWGLTGDRHEGIYLPDGRLFIAFRDRALGSSTYGHYVAWIGSYADLRADKPGDMRVLLLENMAENVWDTGYSGVELLADGTSLCTTYMQYRLSDKAHSVVCTRFRPSDLKLDTNKEKAK